MLSKRKSRIPTSGPLPGNQSADVNANALAAATAIGNALKTGNPIPRSNSMQRTSWRTSSLNRSSSFLGLQTSAGFKFDQQQQQQQQQQHPQLARSRSQSLSTVPKPIAGKPKPRTVKKHIPGPYGLVTIEVPIEEEEERNRRIQRATSLSRKASNRRASSLSGRSSRREQNGSLNSLNSAASSKRHAFKDQLANVQEDFPLDFDSVTATPPRQVIYQHKDLSSINEDITAEENKDLRELKALKTKDEDQLTKELHQEEIKEQVHITEATDQKTPEIEPENASEEPVTSTVENAKPIVAEEPSFQSQMKPSLERFESSSSVDMDQYTDAPSTAKSSDTLNAAQSSYTTQESETEDIKPFTSGTMAQQLRPTIFANKSGTGESDEGTLNGQSLSREVSAISAQSSIYSAEPLDHSLEPDIPARSVKRTENLTPRKSALKNRSSTSINTQEKSSNPAAAAYLSLTTAENTRLNALSSASNVSVNGSASSRSMRNSLRADQNGFRKAPNQLLRPPSLVLKEKNSNGASNPRPQSAQISKPASMQTSKRQSQVKPTYQSGIGNSQVKKSPSGAAAVNATTKKIDPNPPKLEKRSSFEKERPADSHAAFKRMSMRDRNSQQALQESGLGFYRDQNSKEQRGNKHQQRPQPPQEDLPATASTRAYKSRFTDSDSDTDEPAKFHGFAPPPSNPSLRKPQSHIALRSTSLTGIPENSPAKSVPEQRHMRFFSDSDKHFAEPLVEEHKKKKTGFGGKLKKLFGRSKNHPI